MRLNITNYGHIRVYSADNTNETQIQKIEGILDRLVREYEIKEFSTLI